MYLRRIGECFCICRRLTHQQTRRIIRSRRDRWDPSAGVLEPSSPLRNYGCHGVPQERERTSFAGQWGSSIASEGLFHDLDMQL